MSDQRSLVSSDLTAWITAARRDDWHMTFVGSDIRCMLGEIDRLRSQLVKAERRVTALETVIGEDLLPWDCSDDMNRMLVEDIHRARNAALTDEKGTS